MLRQGGKSLLVIILAPNAATFEILPALPGPASPKPAKQASNKGRSKLAVTMKEVKSTKIQVSFTLPQAE